MLNFFQVFFKLTNTERKGALLLLFFILLVFILPRVYFYFEKPQADNDIAFLTWANEQNSLDSIAKFEKYSKNVAQDTSINYFKFDPNTVTYDEMVQLGFTKKTASILLKFRAKGAKFYNKKDLLKVYGFEDDLYQKLADYIVFPKQKEKKNTKDKKEENTIEYFAFDPNTVSKLEMKKLGIPSKTASILAKFRAKGAKFYTKEDVLKVYGFSEKLYSSLEDYIVFPEKTKPETESEDTETAQQIPTLYLIDVNTADSTDFIKLKGIGAFYAKTIIEYRTKLGGFYSIHQLKEAYGISPELFESIANNLSIEKIDCRKINLNTATFKDLIRHPYIDKALTIKILNLKKDIGGFLKPEDLTSYQVCSDIEFEKLKHYLAVE